MGQGCLGAVGSGFLKIHSLVHTDGLVRGCGCEGFLGKREAGRGWMWRLRLLPSLVQEGGCSSILEVRLLWRVSLAHRQGLTHR